ncbi:transglutaminase family protein [Ramlibacter tataouinensis]|uniref:transglutaminase-like domain-containing protein n=1 Tax=Ramlibacter tataouinensis TaxID=94132 RepID=UPI0022F3D66A|nr:transglutaminase family protein [Ramlibacter tataouinensis]WBY03261.1 transglutaminase family protein [Ramlibacter tataouinensis]
MDTTPSPATLAAAVHIDSTHPAVVELAARAQGGSDRERAVSLYHLVRDGYRYDPYRIDLSERGMRASTVIENGYGWCVPKAALLAAVARAAGIPARVGYADVRNHLSTQRLRDLLKTDLYIWHGYTELWIDGRWLKSTPAFNIELCERFGLLPLEWDGTADSIYHPFDRAGRQHMEYVNQRGTFDDVPRRRIAEDFARTYPDWIEGAGGGEDLFQKDVERETR